MGGICSLCLLLFNSCQGYAVRKSRNERITGCTFPDYKIVKSNSGLMSFLGDYSDSYIAEFESIPTSDFYIQIEKTLMLKNILRL